ncbi:hypothetical protein [Virgibacillus necropolis]|uniref:Uncharacterized protein n=1 Tax=Virgibacillus necropolis TaxID=163877 RepID=A0A221MCA6_9BACI|nr:hypothetical protein [Virgibacillus necropolis]ASN05306.1 hypothetical protein CFK40_09920 [Virgibacillus necropolis]
MKITIKRSKDGAIVKVKTLDEPIFTFTNFSPKITHESLKRALPPMIRSERIKRYKTAFRREQLAEAKRLKKEREEATDEANADDNQTSQI